MEFAKRVGISVPTYRKMEHGSVTVPIGYWARVLQVLDCLEHIEQMLQPDELRRARWTNPRTRSARRRVRKRNHEPSHNTRRQHAQRPAALCKTGD